MTEIPHASGADYTKDARRAVFHAVRDEHDFGGWLDDYLGTYKEPIG